MTHKLVAVTACISGVAHTYMAAERLETLCQQLKWQLSIETQGALGVETPLAPEAIAQADAVLLITDIEIDGLARFDALRCVQVSTNLFLREPNRVMNAVHKLMGSPSQTRLVLD